jgi:uncharacterized membrane protein
MKKEKVSKSQEVRLVDVFLLGPFMIWFGAAATGVASIFKIIMIVSGIATIVYNGFNYLVNKGIIKR